jgi:acetylglutamate kinase
MVLASKRKQPDLGFVGEVCTFDAQWIERFWSAGVVPVIASLALGFDGEYYNVNADQMASAFAPWLAMLTLWSISPMLRA